MTTSDYVDVVGCDRSVCESGGGGGGGDGGGSGDGVGEWSGVMGLGEVSCGIASEGRLAWGSGSVGSMVDVTCPITYPSWSDCHVKVDVMCANTMGCVLLLV